MKRSRYKLHFIVLLGVCLQLAACSDNARPGVRSSNLYADAQRSNSYERYGNFNSTLIMDVGLKTDSLSEPISEGLGAIAPALAITSDVVYIATDHGHIVRGNVDYAQWQYKLADGEVVAAAMCADDAENVYAISNGGTLVALDRQGKLRWRKTLFPSALHITYSDLLCLPEGIGAASSSGELTLVDFEGEQQWLRSSDASPGRTFAADSAGNLLLPITHNQFGASDSLLKISVGGELQWSRAFDNTRIYRGPVVSGTKIIVAGMKDAGGNRVAVLHALSTMGRMLWSREMPMTPRGIAAAEDGSIYVNGFDAGVGEPLSTIIAYSPEGDELWREFFEVKIPVPLLVGRENLAFPGIKSNRSTGLYIIRRDGSFQEVVSLSSFPVLNLLPSVGNNGDVIFAVTEHLGYLAVGESALHKLLPF